MADTYLGDVSQPLTLNRYSYTTNNPVMQTDSSGHWPKWLDKAVDTVKNGVQKATTWVSENVVKPVVNTVQSAATWVNNNVIQPVVNTVKETYNEVKKKVTTTVSNAKQKAEEVVEKVQQGYEDIKQTATKKYEQTKQYVQQRAEEIKQKVIEFSCGAAEKLSNAWETATDWVSNAANDVGEWWSNIEWDRVAQGAMIVAGGVLVVAVGAAAIAATGGLAAAAFAGLAAGAFTTANVVVAGTALAGGAAIAFGASDIAEGISSIDLGLKGDTETVAFNPIRDTVFNNDVLTPEMYYMTEMVVTYGAAQGTSMINQNREYYNATVGSGTTAGNTVTAADIQYSDKFSKPQYKNQVSQRGWTNESVADAINNPVKTGESINKYTGNSVTLYYVDDVHYVAVDNGTNKVIQVADLLDPNWVFDLNK